MGKSKCCCTPRKIPYLKFMNLTTVDCAFPIPSAPTDVSDLDKETVLFRDVQAECSYCIFGPLKDCFDLETGEFTVKETGLYAITVLPGFEVCNNTGCTGSIEAASGDRSVRVNRTYGSASRCGTIPDHLGQTQHIGNNPSTTFINTLMTYSAVQPLEAGDKLDFRAFQINPDGFCARLYFEFNIIKLSNASKCLFNPTPTPAPSPLSPCPSPTPDPGPIPPPTGPGPDL